jgi:ribosomal protein L37AE/L43A
MAFKHKETERAYRREWMRKWRKERPEEYRAYMAQYKAANPEKLRANYKRYHDAHKAERNADSLKRWHANSEKYRKTKYKVPQPRNIPHCCEACKIPFVDKSKACFDHHHERGEFRGWLCSNCNLAIGNAKDSRDILLALVDYLDRYELLR